MPEGSSIVSFGEISKPATVLIEKISRAIGGLCKPWQIKRVAKAEAEAGIIKAQGEIEISELSRRAVARFVAEETIKQDNMERITEKALPQLDEVCSPQDIEDDWITNFFDKCRIVSDDEMQSMWAKVLAGEANSPGSYSKRTVTFLGSLDKADALLFTVLRGFIWDVVGQDPLVLDLQDAIYSDKGINFVSLTHLGDIGLVSFNPLGNMYRMELPQEITVAYRERCVNLRFAKPEKNKLRIGCAILTRIGRELTNVCRSEPVDGFLEYVIEKWASEGVVVSSSYSPPPR